MGNFGHNFFAWIGGGAGIFRVIVFFIGCLLVWWTICFFNGVFKKAKSLTKSWKIGAVAVGVVFVGLVVMWANANMFVREMTKPVPVVPLLLPPRGESVIVVADATKGVTFGDLVKPDQGINIRVSRGKAKIYLDDYALHSGSPVPPASNTAIKPRGKFWRLRIKSADVGTTSVVVESF